MGTTTKRMGIIEVFKNLFSSEIDVEEFDYNDIKLPTELQSALIDIDKNAEEVKKGFNSGKASKGGFAKKISDETMQAMREKRDEVVANRKSEEKKVEYEIGD